MPQYSHGDSVLVEVAELAGADAGPVAGVALDYGPGNIIPRHSHDSAQLIYAATGVMTVRTDAGSWVVPPQRAVWVPAFEAHSIKMSGRVEMRTVYIERAKAGPLPADCGVVHVSDLLRELVLRIVAFPSTWSASSPEARVVRVFFDEMRAAPQVPLHLPTARDERLCRITQALAVHPADQRTLAQWARVAGASERTIARLFVSETGMTFGQWCQQARLLAALQRLALGQSVTATALDLGYDSTSAFIAMFKKALGRTPGRYFQSLE